MFDKIISAVGIHEILCFLKIRTLIKKLPFTQLHSLDT